MSVVEDLVKDTKIPEMALIEQSFEKKKVESIKAALERELGSLDTGEINGKSIAITVGSRGIANIAEITKEIVHFLNRNGAEPFVIPAMGSHGGATAEGQKTILETLGVTEEYVECPIKATMEVVEIGKTKSGLPVYVDKYAHEADAIVLLNRIKPHTDFRGEIESGLQKMVAIGLGKQKGAETCHFFGFGELERNIKEINDVVFDNVNILFGIAILENVYHKVYKIKALKKEEIRKEEPELLDEAKKIMPKIPFKKIDVLIVDEIGKEISGDGMDPNVTGRYSTPYASGGPDVKNIVVLNLTKNTHGNANGIGLADITTEKVFKAFDPEMTYPNGITATVLEGVKIPMVLRNDELAIKCAIKTCNSRDPKVVRIKNTLKLEKIMISKNLCEEAVDAGAKVYRSELRFVNGDLDEKWY